MLSHWKENTIVLAEGKEYVYDIQNKNTNCVLLRNNSNSDIFAGIKPHTHEIKVLPNQIRSITRPNRIKYIYLIAFKNSSVDLIETNVSNPHDIIIQQEITKRTIIQDTPNFLTQENFFDQIIYSGSVRGRRFRGVFDLGGYKPTLSVFLRSPGGSTFFIYGSIERTTPVHENPRLKYLRCGTVWWHWVYQPITNNTFRYIYIFSDGRRRSFDYFLVGRR